MTEKTILAIETSCDETGVALIKTNTDKNKTPQLLADALHTQAAMHAEYGGVVPELASRDHIRRLIPLTNQVLEKANHSLEQIDLIAYTKGPGLAGALLTGSGFASALGAALEKPIMGIHHLEGHLLSPFLSQEAPKFPFIALLVSGGHTQLMLAKAVGEYELLGESIDDAAGEAFDKTAKLLGLPYPGGAKLSQLAKGGNPAAFNLPRPLLHSKNLDFSFAGLKTAVLVATKKLGEQITQEQKADLAASTEAAIVEVLIKKSLAAVNKTGVKQLVIAGGVGANQNLRKTLGEKCKARKIALHYPELQYCGDNASMIAMAAAMRIQAGLEQASFDYSFEVSPRMALA